MTESEAGRPIELEVLDLEHAVCRSRTQTRVEVPEARTGTLWSLTVTDGEVSLVCAADQIPAGFVAERGWRTIKVAGVLDLSLVGILASLTEVLARAEVPVFAVSTYDTDYLLVRSERLQGALESLRAAGYSLHGPPG